MPVFKNYSSKGKLINTFKEPLGEANLERFIAEFGEEHARGYFAALQDLTVELHDMIHQDIGGGVMALNTAQKLKTQVTKLYHNNKATLDLSGVTKYCSESNPTENVSNTKMHP